MCVPRYKPALGGGEEHVFQLSRRLIAKGHEVVVYTSDLKTHYPRLSFLRKEILDEGGVDGISVKRFHAVRIFKQYPILKGYFGELMKEDFDIIHAHGYGYFTSDMATVASRLRVKPLVLTTHGFFPVTTPTSRLLRSFYVQYSKAWLMKAASRIITVSFDDAAYYRKLVDPTKIAVIPNGIDLGFWSEPVERGIRRSCTSNAPMILAVGRITWAKGFQYLIRAAPNILRKFSTAKIVIVGEDFGYLKRLIQESLDLAVDRSIEFTGPRSPGEVKKLYYRSDVVVVPSIREPFGIVALEAMACGKPIVASDQGGLAEIIKDGSNGLLFKSADSNSLAEAVVTLLEKPDLVNRISANNRSRATRYSWDNMVQRVENEYHHALSFH